MAKVRSHILSNREDSLRFCYTCGSSLNKNKWKSHFHDEFHYKITKCKTCNKDHSVQVNFMSSGHDSWENEIKSIINLNGDSRKIKFVKNKHTRIGEEFAKNDR